MSGYTPEDIRKLIVGSERANQMKREINFIFQFIISCTRVEVEGIFLLEKGLPKNKTICEVPIGMVSGVDWVLVFRKYKRDMSINLTWKDDGTKGFLGLEYGAEQLSLVLVKPVHEKLPLVLEIVSEALRQQLPGRAHDLIKFMED